MTHRCKSFFAFLVAISISLMPVAALAHSAQSGDISVGHIWSYPSQGAAEQTAFYMHGMPAGNTVDVFGPLLNNGTAPDAVMSVTSPVAQAVNIVMWFRGSQMVHDFPLALPPGTPVALGPETQFLRLYGVSASYKAGDKFPITFHFQNAPDATIDVIVQNRS